ncbi:MAG TPA: hypothetical protein VFF61_10660 [Microvirga sp.]|nr:hypothetical protein [Microvirga sp.]
MAKLLERSQALAQQRQIHPEGAEGTGFSAKDNCIVEHGFHTVIRSVAALPGSTEVSVPGIGPPGLIGTNGSVAA